MNLEDRMKLYEKETTAQKLDHTKPILVRLDGRSFSKKTKKLQKPFDPQFTEAMIETAKYLVSESHALTAYAQSDEITLLLYVEGENSQPFFDGKIQKLTSILASAASAKFNHLCYEKLFRTFAHFDCRVWNVPDKTEATNVFLWRERDALRNSVQMLASHYFSHKQLFEKSTSDQKEMLLEKNISWETLDWKFQRGTFIQKKFVGKELSEDEREAIPEKHRPEQGSLVLRQFPFEIELPCLFADLENKIPFLFDRDKPSEKLLTHNKV